MSLTKKEHKEIQVEALDDGFDGEYWNTTSTDRKRDKKADAPKPMRRSRSRGSKKKKQLVGKRRRVMQSVAEASEAQPAPQPAANAIIPMPNVVAAQNAMPGPVAFAPAGGTPMILNISIQFTPPQAPPGH